MGAKGEQFPGCRTTAGGAESLRWQLKSLNVTCTFFNTSEIASERPQVRTWGRQTCFLPRAPSNFVTPLRRALVRNNTNQFTSQTD